MELIMFARYKIKNLYRSTLIIDFMHNLKTTCTLLLVIKFCVIACEYSSDAETFALDALSTIVIYSIFTSLLNLGIYICKCYIINSLRLFFKDMLRIQDYDNKKYVSTMEDVYDDSNGYTYNTYWKAMNNIINIFVNYETNRERKYLVLNMIHNNEWIKEI